jgi:hypothetical protein
VVWSNESKFQIFGSDGHQYCWKTLGEPLKDTHVKPTVKFGGVAFLCEGVLRLVVLGLFVK